MQPRDRLDTVLNQMKGRLALKEALIAKLEEECENLRTQIGTLDDAAVIVTAALSAGESFAIKQASQSAAGANERGMQAYVLRCVNDINEPGASATDIVKMVKALGYSSNGISERSLYSSVYVSLLRLYRKGEIEQRDGPRGKLFCRLGPTRALFPTGNGHASEFRKGEAGNA